MLDDSKEESQLITAQEKKSSIFPDIAPKQNVQKIIEIDQGQIF